ncbi:indoleamine 2,3-dioxygenase 2 isoform X1 [Alligator mississippiensis]|uniref:indoleamine 2,3-dioxygenase 2 isoform X1 n=1 Tax=Alligator mississippiensis TaxID=8496 RepID=UPI0028781352|nr:indoleamine 2,3-dioxygenase 2 isoform X1 [Alligator mississippiensis]
MDPANETEPPPPPFALDKFHISQEYGFLLPDPQTELPAPYGPWMDLARSLPHLIATRQLRAHVHQVPPLSRHPRQRPQHPASFWHAWPWSQALAPFPLASHQTSPTGRPGPPPLPRLPSPASPRSASPGRSPGRSHITPGTPANGQQPSPWLWREWPRRSRTFSWQTPTCRHTWHLSPQCHGPQHPREHQPGLCLALLAITAGGCFDQPLFSRRRSSAPHSSTGTVTCAWPAWCSASSRQATCGRMARRARPRCCHKTLPCPTGKSRSASASRRSSCTPTSCSPTGGEGIGPGKAPGAREPGPHRVAAGRREPEGLRSRHHAGGEGSRAWAAEGKGRGKSQSAALSAPRRHAEPRSHRRQRGPAETLCSQAVQTAQAIAEAAPAIWQPDRETLLRALAQLATALGAMTEALRLMHDHVDPDTFYTTIRLFLSGWRDNPAMQAGLLYKGVSKLPQEYSGGSAAQSTVLHAFDAFLGIRHHEESSAFLRRMRDYMPPCHRAFVEAIQAFPPLRDLVLSSGNEVLCCAYNGCVTALAAFRTHHIAVATRYVVTAAAKTSRGSLPRLASPSGPEQRGTGGSPVLRFLKSVRDATREALLHV